MTRANAGRITGLHIRQIDKTTWGAFETEDYASPVATGSHYKPSVALKLLVDAVYRIRREEVFDRDGGKCVRCGGQGAHCHHKRHRSHGRDDSADNLELLCSSCHHERHNKGSH